MNTPKPHRSLTLRDVSEAAGVSEMTVSRVLRNRGDVSAATREKVLTAAKSLGYVPNRIAGGLASQRVSLVAVILPSITDPIFAEVLTAISAELDDTPLQPMVGLTHHSPSREEAVLYQMLSWRPSGVVLVGLSHSRAARAMLERASVPVVEIMDVDGDPVDCAVGISHRGAGLGMAAAVAGAGYRRIGFVGTHMPEDLRARKRLKGFEDGLARVGMEVAAREFYQGNSSMAKGRELTERILSRHPDLDFLYYSNDLIAGGGLVWAREQGIDIPGRLGLAGFGGGDLLDGLPPRLATTEARAAEIGRRAGRIAAGKEPRPEGGVIALDPTLRRAETIRPDLG